MKKTENILYWAGYVGLFVWGVQMYRYKNRLDKIVKVEQIVGAARAGIY